MNDDAWALLKPVCTGVMMCMFATIGYGGDGDEGVYKDYEPRDSGYFHWTAQWPTDEWHCGYPVLEGAEIIELTDGKYGDLNGHNTTVRIGDHLFIGHNNHSSRSENSSGQRCLGWIYELGDPWTRESFNKHQDGEPIPLFPLPAPMNTRKFGEDARYFGTPQFKALDDGRIMVRGAVVTLRRGTEDDPDGKVNTWVPVCDLARTITPRGELGPVKLVRVRNEVALRKAQDEGYLQFPDASEEAWVEELFGREMGRPQYKRFATDGYKAAEFRDIVWIDEEAGHAVCMGRGENTYGIFRGYTTETRDGGESWSTPEPTNIPSGENTITFTRLPDGRLAILGTFGDRSRGDRRPLCIAISEDGRTFSHVYRLSESEEKHQMVGVVFDEEYMYVAGPHRSNGNAGRGEHFVLRLPLSMLPAGEDLWSAERPLDGLLEEVTIRPESATGADGHPEAAPHRATRASSRYRVRLAAFPFLPAVVVSVTLAEDTGAGWKTTVEPQQATLQPGGECAFAVALQQSDPHRPRYPLPALQVTLSLADTPDSEQSRLLPLPRPAGRPRLAAKRSTAPPRIDGALDDPPWHGGPDVPVFGRMDQARSVEPVTQAWIGHDEAALYLAFRCNEPAMEQIKTAAKTRDEKVYLDDSVEIMLEPDGDGEGRDSYQIVVNTEGVIFDGQGFDKSVDLEGLQAAASLKTDHWTAEIAIPWADLGLDGPPAEAGILLCRNRQAGGEHEVFQFPISPKGNHQSGFFARMSRQKETSE